MLTLSQGQYNCAAYCYIFLSAAAASVAVSSISQLTETDRQILIAMLLAVSIPICAVLIVVTALVSLIPVGRFAISRTELIIIALPFVVIATLSLLPKTFVEYIFLLTTIHYILTVLYILAKPLIQRRFR
jgi:hypothetical protein